MRNRIFKIVLSTLILVVLIFVLLMVTPRMMSVFLPGKPPLGYHFENLHYLAVGVGLEKIVERNDEVPDIVEEIKNIEYKNINGKSLQLDIYKLKDLKEPAPLLVFIHGGGWRGGNRSDYKKYLVYYAKKGYVTATVSYRLIKDGLYPACAEDITDAVQWFFQNGDYYGYDADRIALLGGSAGGHLSLLAAYGWGKYRTVSDSATVASDNRRIKAVVDLYGPVDLTTDYARSHPTVTGFFHHSYEETPELYLEASPLLYLDETNPPTLILHGTSDNLVPVSQSDMLKARLDAMGVPCEYYRLPLWPHSMDVMKRVSEYSLQKIDAFLEKYL